MTQFVGSDPRRTTCCGATELQVKRGRRPLQRPEKHDSPTVTLDDDGRYSCDECGVTYVRDRGGATVVRGP